jgi:hypothetical protein
MTVDPPSFANAEHLHPSLPSTFPSPSLHLSVSSVPLSPPGRAHPKGHRRLVINPLSAFECSPCPWVCGSLVCSREIVAERPIPPVPPGESLCVVSTVGADSFSLLNPSLRPGADGRPIPRAGHAPAPHCVCCPWTRPCPGPAAPHLIRRSETPGPQGPHPYASVVVRIRPALRAPFAFAGTQVLSSGYCSCLFRSVPSRHTPFRIVFG